MSLFLSLTLLLAQPSRALTWDECVKEAAERNPRVQAARRSVEAAEAARAAAYAGYQPQVLLAAGESRYNTIFGNAPLNFPPTTSVVFGPQLSWNLFSGFSTDASVEQGDARLRQTAADLESQEASARGDLRRAFGRLLFEQETLSLSQAIAQRLKSNADFIKLKYEGGVEAHWSFLKASADAKQAAWEVNRAWLDLKSAQRHLGELLGLASGEDLRAAGDLKVPGPGSEPDPLERAAQHPGYRSQAAQESAARGQLRSARSGNWPSLDLSGLYNLQGDSWAFGSRSWSLGATLSYKLFSGGQVRAAVRQSESRLDAQRDLSEASLRELADAVESAYGQYRAAFERVGVESALLEAAGERSETVQALYANGQATFLEWDTAQSAYTDAQKSELSARLDAYDGLAAWEQSLGAGLK